MSESKDFQVVFMEAVSSLKEFAKVNGGHVTKDDVISYFKDMDLDEGKLQMIYGYLLANNIVIDGEKAENNDFFKVLSNASAKEDVNNSELNNDYMSQFGEEENILTGPENIKPIKNDNLDYNEDEKFVDLYLKDLEKIEKLSDQARAFLLMNIVEDNDKESLQLLTESFLQKIVKWVEPYRKKGILASDLIQEGNLTMMSYIGEKKWLNNAEWKEKIKEGSTTDLINVLDKIEEELNKEIQEAFFNLFMEQSQESEATDKVLEKVNKVNDKAVLLKEELGRKPTVYEVANELGVDVQEIYDAIQFSADAIEDIDVKGGKKDNEKK